MSTCPACHQPVRSGLINCSHCGYQLASASLGSTLPVSLFSPTAEAIELAPPQNGEIISLLVRSSSGLIPLPLSAKRHMILGRYDLDTQAAPDVDLSIFGAHNLGVSRFHAAIDCGSASPTLTDLGSSNGTELNGVRIKPYEIYRLRHNDVICLAKLVLYLHC